MLHMPVRQWLSHGASRHAAAHRAVTRHTSWEMPFGNALPPKRHDVKYIFDTPRPLPAVYNRVLHPRTCHRLHLTRQQLATNHCPIKNQHIDCAACAGGAQQPVVHMRPRANTRPWCRRNVPMPTHTQVLAFPAENMSTSSHHKPHKPRQQQRNNSNGPHPTYLEVAAGTCANASLRQPPKSPMHIYTIACL